MRGSYKPREPGSVKEAVDLLFTQAGGRKRVADLFDIGETQVAALTDPASREQLSVSRAAALTSARAPAMAEFFALRADGVFIPMGDDDAHVPILCAESAKAHGESIAEVVAALKDGDFTRPEAKRALVKLRTELRALSALYQAVMDVAKPDGGP
ncbi:MAG: hypothetical protein KIS73_24660 [Enhydrobacter sp.]|nr:hypothetical protein [Enhydrobacter sp.]